MHLRALLPLLAALALAPRPPAEAGALVLLTDFGTKDGAVAAMKGVAIGVDARLPVFDLTHEITPYDIWEAAYRLKQTASYWPAGTVFVSVVDPGVGTDRASIVLETRSGHFFVGPDNGAFTLVAEDLGIAGVRTIDESRNRLAGSAESYTFHGRDVYAYTGARLAAGVIPFAEVGPEFRPEIVRLPYERARLEDGALVGTIPALDVQYGNVWTNIGRDLFQALEPRTGEPFLVTIRHRERVAFAGEAPFVATFGEVPEGRPLLYLNSLLHLSLALNLDSFVARHGIAAGGDWSVRIERPKSR